MHQTKAFNFHRVLSGILVLAVHSLIHLFIYIYVPSNWIWTLYIHIEMIRTIGFICIHLCPSGPLSFALPKNEAIHRGFARSIHQRRWSSTWVWRSSSHPRRRSAEHIRPHQRGKSSETRAPQNGGHSSAEVAKSCELVSLPGFVRLQVGPGSRGRLQELDHLHELRVQDGPSLHVDRNHAHRTSM